MNTNKILKISSDYNIRILFSYLDYNYIIKLIKYSKCLQNKLNIKLEHNNYIIKEKLGVEKNLDIFESYQNSMDISFLVFAYFYVIYSVIFSLNQFFIPNKLVTSIIIILSFIYINYFNRKNHILIRFLIPFSISLFKKKFFYLKYLLLIVIRIGPPFIVQIFCLPNGEEFESILYLKIKVIISIIIFCLTFIYDLFLRLIIINDFHFVINIIYTIYIFIFNILIFLFYWNYFNYLKNTIFYITEYKNIEINDYCLPNLEKENNKEKLLKKIYKNFKIKRSKEEVELVSKINKFRAQNKLGKILVNTRIPDFIINKPSEIILFPYKKFYKYSNGPNYIFKINLKDSNFLNDPEMKNIILDKNVDRFYLIREKDVFYISPSLIK